MCRDPAVSSRLFKDACLLCSACGTCLLARRGLNQALLRSSKGRDDSRKVCCARGGVYGGVGRARLSESDAIRKLWLDQELETTRRLLARDTRDKMQNARLARGCDDVFVAGEVFTRNIM